MDDDGAPKGIDGGGTPMKGSGSQSWLRDLWSSQRSSQMQMGRTTYASGSLPVFGVSPSALWWKEPHAFADYSSEDGGQEAEEAELARAAQAALEIAQAASRELLSDLQSVTKSLGFWETKLHDTPRKIWWFLLLQTGPGHFFGEVYRGLQDLLSVCSLTLRRSKPRQTPQRKLPRMSPHLLVDGKVRALSSMQFSLCVAVGEVHRYAGIVAAAWGASADTFDTADLRATLQNALDGLLATLKGVSASKASLQSSARILQEGRLSQTVPQSPLSKAVNTEFPRHTTAHRKSTLGSVKIPVVEINEKDAGGGDNDALWQLVHSLECEGSRASLCAKTVIAANTKPQKWQRRWLLYSGLATAFGSLSLFTIRHSRLCGSSDLDQLIIQSELTLAFEQNTDVVGIQQLESSKASLGRMLEQYTRQATRPGYSAALYRAYRAVGGGKTEQGTSEPVPLDPFALVTARVEEELKSPLQNMLGGDLMQLLLIQTQVMKVDMESALLQMDQIMRANRLNFSLMAGLPTLLAVVSLVSLGSTSLGARTHKERSQNREDMRLLLNEAERALAELLHPPKSRAQASCNQSFERGMLLFSLNTLYQSVLKHRQFFSPAEWRSVKQDITALADNDVAVESKLTVIGRMRTVNALRI